MRFWIGTQDAKGCVKAKAALEKDNWHTHAELPSPMPIESKLRRIGYRTPAAH